MTDIKEVQGLEVVAWRYTSAQRIGGKWHYQETFPKWDDRKVQELGQYEELCRLSDATAVIDQLRERVAELETDLKLTSEMLVGVSRKGMALQEELAALKSAPVVIPENLKPFATSTDYASGWNDALSEVLRLNRSKA